MPGGQSRGCGRCSVGVRVEVIRVDPVCEDGVVAGGVLPDCVLTGGVGVDVLACAKELTPPWASSTRSNTNGGESNLVLTGILALTLTVMDISQ